MQGSHLFGHGYCIRTNRVIVLGVWGCVCVCVCVRVCTVQYSKIILVYHQIILDDYCLFADFPIQVIQAEGEQKASIALKEAARIMEGSESALQLRYLQTMNTIAGEKNSTILFPLPIDMLTGFE